MASSIVSGNLTSGFIDLATFDELEKYMYGCGQAVTYFVRETRKSTWFTQVPTVLQRSNGCGDFGAEWSANITRAGDYLLQTWLRLDIPSVVFSGGSSATGLRWTRNLGHNIIREASCTFNDLSAQRFDNYFLDFWAAFTTPAGKQVGYNNMIGNVSDLILPVASGQTLRGYTLNIPLPFFFTRDSGVALPTAALPYNDMKIQLYFRDWSELLIVDNANATAGQPASRPAALSDVSNVAPSLGNVYVWANYAIVSNDERKRMGCAPRDILIEQVQTTCGHTWTPATNPNPCYDIRFSHAIKALFFSVRNTTNKAEWSNYTSNSPVVGITPSGAVVPNLPEVTFNANFPYHTDPIQNVSLVYENTARLTQVGSDYFSLVQPYYQPGAVIPTTTGYHLYSYSLDFVSLDPKGSTNYGKLTNVSISPSATSFAVDAASGTFGTKYPVSTGLDAVGFNPSGTNYPQTYQVIISGVNNNVIRVSGGALGFPVL
jgi:Major capsid protein N-terminus/Large eukaryotic DNA virus major capsid protein